MKSEREWSWEREKREEANENRPKWERNLVRTVFLFYIFLYLQYHYSIRTVLLQYECLQYSTRTVDGRNGMKCRRRLRRWIPIVDRMSELCKWRRLEEREVEIETGRQLEGRVEYIFFFFFLTSSESTTKGWKRRESFFERPSAFVSIPDSETSFPYRIPSFLPFHTEGAESRMGVANQWEISSHPLSIVLSSHYCLVDGTSCKHSLLFQPRWIWQ